MSALRKNHDRTSPGNLMLLNPLSWIFAWAFEAARYCRDCAAPVTLAGLILMSLILVVLLVAFAIYKG